MRDFDSDWAERRSADARTFKVLGETFVIKKAIRPEALAAHENEINEESSAEQSMAVLDDLFLSMIEHDNDAEGRWRALRADEDGLGMLDIREILDWVMEVATGRSPTSPGVSSPGRTPTGTSSMGGSSSRALQAVSRA